MTVIRVPFGALAASLERTSGVSSSLSSTNTISAEKSFRTSRSRAISASTLPDSFRVGTTTESRGGFCDLAGLTISSLRRAAPEIGGGRRPAGYRRPPFRLLYRPRSCFRHFSQNRVARSLRRASPWPDLPPDGPADNRSHDCLRPVRQHPGRGDNRGPAARDPPA